MACTALPFDTSPASGKAVRPAFEFDKFMDFLVFPVMRIVSENFPVADATAFETWRPAIGTAFHLVIDRNVSSFERDNPAPEFDPGWRCNVVP